MARVDAVLAGQVKRYAALHRQPLSVVIRDALTLLMEEYPAGADLPGPHPLTEHEFPSDRYESTLDTLVAETDSATLEELLSDSNQRAIAILDTDEHSDREYVSGTNEDEAIVSDTIAKEHMVSDTNTQQGMVSDTNTIQEIPSDRNTVSEMVSDSHTTAELPPYDPTKYVLGKLCPGRHEHGTTGRSLLRLPKRQCDLCKRAANTQYRQAKQQKKEGA